ncbi:MAG TPA: nicotinate-nucleotide adenylyltransferase [Thermomicrobiales bacterium]|jgi:nicotinate-nucleotide adenylyltransferase
MSEWHPGPRPRRIGIYGGTFDPVHHGHLVAAAEVSATLGLDHLVFMPAGQPPHKRDLAISDAQHRVRMLELAIAGRPQFALSARDLAPDRPSYTADLLAHLHDAWGEGHTLFFVMGEDSLRDFPTWHAPERIAALAQLAVVTRPNVAVEIDAIIRAVPTLAGRVHPVAIPQLDIASHDLRARVAAARPIAYQVPEAVERYIHDTGLYRVNAMS